MLPVGRFNIITPNLISDDWEHYRTSGLEGILSTIGDTASKVIGAVRGTGGGGSGSIAPVTPIYGPAPLGFPAVGWLILGAVGVGVWYVFWGKK